MRIREASLAFLIMSMVFISPNGGSRVFPQPVQSTALDWAMRWVSLLLNKDSKWDEVWSFPVSVMANALSKVQLILQENKHKIPNQNIGINCHYCGQLRNKQAEQLGNVYSVWSREAIRACTHLSRIALCDFPAEMIEVDGSHLHQMLLNSEGSSEML